ncbi:MFS transporter [Stenotrophomonas aracearum]|uniref:MFS transporter n=1 Tax=Stenotrophomonas aracearum TaxID=3003272 RepID=A0ABY9YG51_9GAMM|nr:MFS transporter [Stenotrophomonas sp. A5588]WNH49672.1 MFS transporter [Stenotrophomonas sp. A5588]
MSSDVASLPATDAPPSILSPRYRATTVGMVALVSLHAFEALAVAAAMPTVAHDLDGLRLYALAFGGTLATSVIGMTLAGRWSDRLGPARPLWLGLACFIAGLLVAGFAQHMPVLVLGRLLQGLGAGAISVALYVLVGRTFPESLRPRVFAAFSAGWVVPSLIGPAISGLIVQHLGWRWVFLGVPLLAIPAALLLRPALRAVPPLAVGVGSNRSVVRWAIGASLGALLLYVGGQQVGWPALALLLPAIALLALCSWKLLPQGTLRLRRGLPSVIALRGIAASAFFGCEAFLPLLLQRERGLSPLLAGVALSLGALGWFSGSWFQGHQGQGMSRRTLLGAGALLMCAGIIGTALAIQPGVPLWLALAGWTLTGLGMGLIYPSLSVLTLSLSPPAQQGANTSALQLSEALAVATTLAVSGSLFAWMLSVDVTLGYLQTFAIMLLLAAASVVVARRV